MLGETVKAIEAVLGAQACIKDEARMASYLVDRRGRYCAKAALVARPGTTEEVSRVVRLCHQHGVGVIPQGGNTGLVGASIPDESGRQVLLSLDRMRRVRAIDALDFTMTVEAGCILADVQAAAREAGLLFPMSLASEGSCLIGGNLATNAGGTAVLRYGSARDLVLGLEVVLADGAVWNGLRALRKDNTGYCLRHLFVGCEGTLGIITAAVLKLFPRPRQVVTALVAVPDAHRACRLLSRCRNDHGDVVTGFEYIDRACLDLVFRHIPGMRDPLRERYEHYVLVELGCARSGGDLRAELEGLLESALGLGEVLDAAVAATSAQAAALWKLRESIPEAARSAGPGIRHDVSVPVSKVAEFLDRARDLVCHLHPCACVIAFGHMGDGNIHFNITKPPGVDADAFLAPEQSVHAAIYDLVADMHGSFSAEHGIGRQKRGELRKYRPAVEVELMRTLKRALDPENILNPGRVV